MTHAEAVRAYEQAQHVAQEAFVAFEKAQAAWEAAKKALGQARYECDRLCRAPTITFSTGENRKGSQKHGVLHGQKAKRHKKPVG